MSTIGEWWPFLQPWNTVGSWMAQKALQDEFIRKHHRLIHPRMFTDTRSGYPYGNNWTENTPIQVYELVG